MLIVVRPVLAYGQSVTDSCMDIGVTAEVLGVLAGAARERHGQLIEILTKTPVQLKTRRG